VKLRRSFLMITLAIATTIALSSRASAQPAADGPVTIAVHVSLAPTWFDPAETPGVMATAGRAADDHGTSLPLAVRGPEAEGTVTS